MLRALFNGFVGAIALTAAHQALRRSVTDAPKMDKLGKEAVKKLYDAVGKEPPRGNQLYLLSLIGDIITNTLLYSQVGSKGGAGAIGKGISIGLSTGLGTATLPPLLGFSKDASQKNRRTAAMTVGLYLIGGIAAAWAAQCGSQSE